MVLMDSGIEERRGEKGQVTQIQDNGGLNLNMGLASMLASISRSTLWREHVAIQPHTSKHRLGLSACRVRGKIHEEQDWWFHVLTQISSLEVLVAGSACQLHFFRGYDQVQVCFCKLLVKLHTGQGSWWSLPGKPNPTKVSSWTFRGGKFEPKVDVNCACFPKERHPKSQKRVKFMNFLFRPFVWFGLPGRLLSKGSSRCQYHRAGYPSKARTPRLCPKLVAWGGSKAADRKGKGRVKSEMSKHVAWHWFMYLSACWFACRGTASGTQGAVNRTDLRGQTGPKTQISDSPLLLENLHEIAHREGTRWQFLHCLLWTSVWSFFWWNLGDKSWPFFTRNPPFFAHPFFWGGPVRPTLHPNTLFLGPQIYSF